METPRHLGAQNKDKSRFLNYYSVVCCKPRTTAPTWSRNCTILWHWRKRSIPHPTETTIELFATARLNDRAMRKVETHLIVCAACRARVAVEDSIREMFRIGMAQPDWMLADPAETRLRASTRNVAKVENIDSPFANVVPRVLHFRTHLPVYSLAAAAGASGEQQAEVQPEGWVEISPGPVLITTDMFVTHIRGRSMEPAIPDGSLCVFRSQVSASLEGKTVLIEDYGKAGGNRYSVKRYHAAKQADPLEEGDPAWLHERITLQSVNPAYRPLEIPSDRKVNVIGEFAFIVA
jgi:SOS-response transcriptional repressor LexA